MLHFRKWIFPLLLFVYHLGFSYLGWRYINENKGDAQRYWFLNADLEQSSWSDYLNPGTDIVKIITFPLVKYLEFPFWSGFLIFSSISGFGLVILVFLAINLAAFSAERQFSEKSTGTRIVFIPYKINPVSDT